MSIQSRILRRWNDSRFSWNPEKYDDIKSIFVSEEYLWTPKLFLNESHYHYGLGSCQPTNCLIKHSSEIACLMACEQTAKCTSNYTDWPFDIQSCHVVFRSFLTHEDVSFDSEKLSGTMATDSNKRFKIIEAKAKINPLENNNVRFTFILQRFGLAIYMHIHVPIFVLTFLTLSVLWIKPGSYVRTFICGISIFLHFNLMDRVWWQ